MESLGTRLLLGLCLLLAVGIYSVFYPLVSILLYIYPSYDVITYVAQVVYSAYTPLSQQYTDHCRGESHYIADSE